MFFNTFSLRAEERAVFSAVLPSLGRFVSAPTRFEREDFIWIAPTIFALGVSINTDIDTHKWVEEHGNENMDPIMDVTTEVGNAALQSAFVLSGWAFGSGRFRELSAAAAQGLLISGATVVTLKPAISSIRPNVAEGDRRFFDYSIGAYSSKSFPSGHSTTSFCLAEIYGSEYGRWWTYPIAAAVAYSRIYVNRHWTSDTVAGAVLGVLIGQTVLREFEEKGPAVKLWSMGYTGEKVVLSRRF